MNEMVDVNTYLPSKITLLDCAGIIASTLPQFKGKYLGFGCMVSGTYSLGHNIINSYNTGEGLSRRALVDFAISVATITVGYAQLATDFSAQLSIMVGSLFIRAYA